MKKLIFTQILLGILCTVSFAQTKIGGTPGAANTNAYLELDASGTPKKGLLHSRVALTATTNAAPLSAHVAGMMVYNTASAGDVTPGIYYNDGTKWVRSSTGDQFTTIEYGSGAPSSSCISGRLYTDTLATSTTLGQQWTCSGGSWVSYVAPAGTEWYLTGTTNDAGANKESHIYRNNAISIRNTVVNSNSTLAPGALELYRFSDPAALFPTNGYIDFKDKITDDYDVRIYYNSAIGTNGALVFHPTTDGTPGTGDGQSLVINNSNGYIGVGTSAPASQLHVKTSATSYGHHTAMFSGAAGWISIADGSIAGEYNSITKEGDARIIFSPDNNGTITSTRGLTIAPHSSLAVGVRIQENGNVGINTGSPTAALSVNGAANNLSGTWGVFSDKRIKTIDSEFTDGLNIIKKIRPIKYHYNKNAPFLADDQQIGIVAQELEEVAPYMVKKKDFVNKDGVEIKDLREVDGQAYVFLLINAVKEQQKKIEDLEARIDAQQLLIGKTGKKGKNSRKVAYTKQR
jgi:hypothetical protein